MIAIPSAARREYDLAEAYLCCDPHARTIFSHAQDSVRRFRLQIDRRGDDRFDPNDDTIHWDPHSALRTTSGGRQSPALGLLHELAHAVEAPAREASLAAHRVRNYDTAEERRVIRGPEREAARSLGEASRCDHRGSLYRVATPVSR